MTQCGSLLRWWLLGYPILGSITLLPYHLDGISFYPLMMPLYNMLYNTLYNMLQHRYNVYVAPPLDLIHYLSDTISEFLQNMGAALKCILSSLFMKKYYMVVYQDRLEFLRA